MAKDLKLSSPPKKMQLTFDEDKNSPLHFAAARGDESEVIQLLNNGHKTDPENHLGWTPLMMAAGNGHFETVRALINRNADATRQNMYGVSVFIISISSGRIDIVQLLLRHLLSGGVSKQSMELHISPISIAVLHQNMEIFNFLIEQGFNVNQSSPDTGITPIMTAAALENHEFFNALVSKGADQYAKNCINQSALDILQTKPNQSMPPPPLPSQPAPAPPVHPNASNIVITPYPCQHPMFDFSNVHVRRSSNVMSPCITMSPNLSPISSLGYLSTQLPLSPVEMGPVIHSPVIPTPYLNVVYNHPPPSPMFVQYNY